MKFTGRAEMQWTPRQTDDGQSLDIGPVRVGFAYPLTVLDESGYAWGVYNAPLHGLTDTLEESKSALLAALGIVVEWDTPQGEVEP